jgi:hypothetical protein
MSEPGAFAVAGSEEQEGGEPPPLAGAGIDFIYRWSRVLGLGARRRPTLLPRSFVPRSN